MEDLVTKFKKVVLTDEEKKEPKVQIKYDLSDFTILATLGISIWI